MAVVPASRNPTASIRTGLPCRCIPTYRLTSVCGIKKCGLGIVISSWPALSTWQFPGSVKSSNRAESETENEKEYDPLIHL